MRSILAKLDELPDQLLLLGCAGLAAFVMVAHGGALLVRHLAPPDQAAMVTHIARYSLPLGGLVLATSIVGMLKPQWRSRILGLQGVILVLSSIALVAWASTLLVRGIPEGNFAWTPGFLTAWVCFSFYLMRRYLLPAGWSGAIYVPLVAAGITLPIDIGVLLRFLVKLASS